MFSPVHGIEKRWKRLKEDRKYRLKAGAVLFLFLSLLFSLGDGLVFFFGWLSMGVMGALLLYRLLERYFFLLVWLVGIYISVFIGSVIAFGIADETGNWFLMILGYSFIIGALIAVIFLILFMKERRDLIALESEYVPIGLWWPLVFCFFWSSLFGVVGWINWARTGSVFAIILYMVAESILIPILVFICDFPERRFLTPYLDIKQETSALKGFVRKMFGGSIILEDKAREREKGRSLECPMCSAPLSKEIRKCPSCDTPRFFFWCGRSEEFMVRCPNCGMLTPLGRTRCIECSIRMSNKIRCSKCRNIHSINEWI